LRQFEMLEGMRFRLGDDGNKVMPNLPLRVPRNQIPEVWP
jgi:hypothetical protein